MKRHIFVIATALSIGITLAACGPAPSHQLDDSESIGRHIGKILEKNGDS